MPLGNLKVQLDNGGSRFPEAVEIDPTSRSYFAAILTFRSTPDSAGSLKDTIGQMDVNAPDWQPAIKRKRSSGSAMIF